MRIKTVKKYTTKYCLFSNIWTHCRNQGGLDNSSPLLETNKEPLR